MTDKNIGIKIKQIRKLQGLSQIELAEKIGISFQQIQKYEKGTTKISVARLQQLSDAFGIPINTFFEDEKISKVSDFSVKYTPGGKQQEVLHPISREEMTFLKLLRKIKNKKIKEGILKQLRGVVELEKKK